MTEILLLIGFVGFVAFFLSVVTARDSVVDALLRENRSLRQTIREMGGNPD